MTKIEGIQIDDMKLLRGNFQWLIMFFFLALSQISYAQYSITHLEPPNWWVGMEYNEIELLVHGDRISDLNAVIDHAKVELIHSQKANSPNYLFLTIKIQEDCPATTVNIEFYKNKKLVITHPFPIESRSRQREEVIGFNSSDVVYLITPDRFANGDTDNDETDDTIEKIDRTNEYGRHGGDLAGILDHLDYFDDLGFTALWLNPILENNMPNQSYHGYATTDYYRVDPRFGSLEDYQLLDKELEKRDMKLIMDMVANHCGSNHWWMQDLPFHDWLNYQNKYELTNHQKSTAIDPYASDIDTKLMTKGWFVPTMPDLNQRNIHMANYLIQNSIWWIERVGLDGIRQDTYSYPDHDFINRWSCEIMREYPNFNIVGEEWHLDHAITSRWQSKDGEPNKIGSCLPSIMDFSMQKALVDGLIEQESWNSGLKKLYESLAFDGLYANPNDIMVFADNHDMSRIFTQLKEDPELQKLAMTYILTTRGIPQIFYGTEILMSNEGTDSHGVIRKEFPGGWEDSRINAFEEKGLSSEATEMLMFSKKILQWRKSNEVIHKGNLKHFVPKDGIYVYCRYLDGKYVLVVLNKSKKVANLDLERFSECIPPKTTAEEVISGSKIKLDDTLIIQPKSSLILSY